MTIRGFSWAWNLRGVTPTAKLVALRVGDNADADGLSTVSINRLEEFSGLDSDEIVNSLQNLLEQEKISDVRFSDDTVCVRIIWGDEATTLTPVLPPKSMRTVYVVTSGGKTKVGITSDLKGRLSTFKNSIPYPVELAWKVELVEVFARKVERAAHALLIEHRLKGEWFSITSAQAIVAIERAIDEVAR